MSELKLNGFCRHGVIGVDCPICNPTVIQNVEKVSITYTKAKNPKENLCDTCMFCIADCDADNAFLIFGTGLGHDNVIECNAYKPKGNPIRLDAKALLDKVYIKGDLPLHNMLVKRITEVFTAAINEGLEGLEEKIEALNAMLEQHEKEDGHGL